MKKGRFQILWSAGLALALGAVCLPAHAGDVRFEIPFSFTVGAATLPAGSYGVSTNRDVLWLRGYAHSAFVMTSATRSAHQTGAVLVFHKYGDQYVLRQLWRGSSGRQLPESSVERELALAALGNPVAAQFEIVLVRLS